MNDQTNRSEAGISSYEPIHCLLGAEGDIRLLKLLPHPDPEAQIECRLVKYSLQRERGTHGHLYEALSYVWGDASITLPILANEQKLDITVNLHAALKQFRDPDFERIFWIDAICINQKDLEEQGSQVQMMAQIYACASRVIVWLGPKANDSSSAFSMIRLSSRAAIKDDYTFDPEQFWECSKCESWTPRLQPCSKCGLQHEKAAGDCDKGVSYNHRIDTLLKRQWFKRIWALQEVAAAKSILVTCGEDTINGYAFYQGLKSLPKVVPASNFFEDDFRFSTPGPGPYDGALHIKPGVHLMQHSVMDPEYVTTANQPQLNINDLGELINMFHRFDATDWRDKVYALLGMVEPRSDIDTTTIVPDYTIAWDVLFKRTLSIFFGETAEIHTSKDSLQATIVGKGFVLRDSDFIQKFSFQNDPFQNNPRIKFKGDLVVFLQGARFPCIIRRKGEYFKIVGFDTRDYHKEESIRNKKPHWLDRTNAEEEYRHTFLLFWNWKGTEPNCDGSSRSQHDTEIPVTLNRAFLFEQMAGIEFERDSSLKNKQSMNAIDMALEALKDADEMDVDATRYRLRMSRIIYESPDVWYNVVENIADDDSRKWCGKIDSKSIQCVKNNIESIIVQELRKNRFETLIMLSLLVGDTFTLTPNISEALAIHHQPQSFEILEPILATDKRRFRLKVHHLILLRPMIEFIGIIPPIFGHFIRSRSEESIAIDTTTDFYISAAMEELFTSKIPSGDLETIFSTLDTFAECSKIDCKPLKTLCKIYFAAFSMDEVAVSKLIQSGADPNYVHSGSHNTLLGTALAAGDSEIVRILLISSRVDVDKMSPLHYAAKYSRIESCKLLLQHGSDQISKNRFGHSPLHEAASHGHFEICELLLHYGSSTKPMIDVNSKGYWGDSPLHRAAISGHFEICKLLLHHGSSTKPMIDVNSKDFRGYSPLHRAAINGHSKTCELLLQYGPDQSSRVDVNSQSDEGKTPLHSALTFQSNVQTCEILLHHGADPRLKSKFQGSPFDFAKQKIDEEVEKWRIGMKYCKDSEEKGWNYSAEKERRDFAERQIVRLATVAIAMQEAIKNLDSGSAIIGNTGEFSKDGEIPHLTWDEGRVEDVEEYIRKNFAADFFISLYTHEL